MELHAYGVKQITTKKHLCEKKKNRSENDLD
jgi:hypothetical protein